MSSASFPHESDVPPSTTPPIGDAVDVPDEMYERIVQQVRELQETLAPVVAPVEPLDASLIVNDEGVLPPRAPESLQDAGLSLGQLSQLVLKLMYLHGSLRGFEVAGELRLPFSVVVESLDFLKSERCLEVSSGDLAGRLSYRFQLTESGRNRAREAFEECRYVGPAPVSIEQYTLQCRRQAIRHVSLTPSHFEAAFESLVLEPEFIQRLGPAVCSGQSIFLHGAPGNGKTAIARVIGQLLNQSGGEIYVPYALAVDQQIISFFDPSIHRVVEEPGVICLPLDGEDERVEASREQPDGRWRRVRRPVVISAGELSLEMLDLRWHASSGFYVAPIHMKANGGVFLLDDFGRQLVPPQQLLNRWILPLDERMDYLTLATGKKFAVPFEQLIIFSTNLAPDEITDGAFLRRIRHKIEVAPPSEHRYREIFRICCEQKSIRYDDWIVTRLLNSHYNPQIPPKSSDPRDLLDIVEAICRFRGERPHLSEKVVSEAFEECLGGLQLHQ